jgi:sarcosine oxidase subunit beta
MQPCSHDGFHFRARGGRVLLLWPALGAPGLPFDTNEMSLDRHAILGATPGVPNLFLINGSSGHGVMHAPALGQLLAEIICDGRATTFDARPLRPERFAEGDLNPVSELL